MCYKLVWPHTYFLLWFWNFVACNICCLFFFHAFLLIIITLDIVSWTSFLIIIIPFQSRFTPCKLIDGFARILMKFLSFFHCTTWKFITERCRWTIQHKLVHTKIGSFNRIIPENTKRRWYFNSIFTLSFSLSHIHTLVHSLLWSSINLFIHNVHSSSLHHWVTKIFTDTWWTIRVGEGGNNTARFVCSLYGRTGSWCHKYSSPSHLYSSFKTKACRTLINDVHSNDFQFSLFFLFLFSKNVNIYIIYT